MDQRDRAGRRALRHRHTRVAAACLGRSRNNDVLGRRRVGLGVEGVVHGVHVDSLISSSIPQDEEALQWFYHI